MAEPNKWLPRNPELPGAEDGSVSKESALAACFAMALFYVAVLYAPTYVLRLPPASSLNTFMIRRFISAIFASLASILLCSRLLPGQAVAIPLCLTSLFYAGSVVSRLLTFSSAWEQEELHQESYLVRIFKAASQRLVDDAHFVVLNILAWRNYVVAPITEELVFRACMIPLLLCAGFKTYNIIFLSPIFFSLGHLIAPIVAHVFCNIMGLPVVFPNTQRAFVLSSFLIGCGTFFILLFPATSPDLYSSNTKQCRCWHRFCSWGRTL